MNNNIYTDGTFKRENVSLKSAMKALTSPSRKIGITQCLKMASDESARISSGSRYYRSHVIAEQTLLLSSKDIALTLILILFVDYAEIMQN